MKIWPFRTAKAKAVAAVVTRDLEGARGLDTFCNVFGADSHHYHVSPVTELQVEYFESRHNIRLPEPYRLHLLGAGHGAGPYYGLWSFQQIEDEMSLYQSPAHPEIPPFEPSEPFRLSLADAERCHMKAAAGDGDAAWIGSPWPAPGCLPIAHHGCDLYSVLQLNGPEAGSVWSICDCGGWFPALRPPGIISRHHRSRPLPPLSSLPKFDEWYQAWIDRVVSDLT